MRGDPAALLTAIAFALLFNVALVTTVVWPGWIRATQREAIWAAVLVVWAASLVASWRWWRSREASEEPAEQDLFQRTLDQYLQGNWGEAERLLRQMLRRRRHDADARLLLVSLLRRRRRLDEAEEQLERLAACEGARKWAEEMRREQRLIAAARQTRDDEQPTNTTSAAAA